MTLIVVRCLVFQVRGWTLRQVTPLASSVQRVPYPIPPAGADPLTWQSEEEPPPLGVSFPLPPDVVLLQVRACQAWGAWLWRLLCNREARVCQMQARCCSTQLLLALHVQCAGAAASRLVG